MHPPSYRSTLGSDSLKRRGARKALVGREDDEICIRSNQSIHSGRK